MYKPVKLAFELFEPKRGADDRLSPLIFLHGFTSCKELTWGDMPQAIADQTKRKTYNLDSRNHGGSEWSDEFDFDLNAEDVLHFMDEKGLPKVVIVGHSMGGITAIKVALKAPGRIDMLFIEEMYVRKVTQDFMDNARSYMKFWREAEKFIPKGVDKEDADDFITDYVLRKTRPETYRSDFQEPRSNYSYPLKKDSSGRYVFNVNLEVILEKLKNGETIMLENEGIYDGHSYFLYATGSSYQVGKEKNHILKHFPRAVFIPFETSNHYVHREFSDLFVETVVKFIKENEKK